MLMMKWNMQTMQNTKMCKRCQICRTCDVCKICEPNLPTKPNLPNLTYQTNPTGPNLPNYTYQSKRKLMVKAADAWVRSAFGNVCSKLQSVPRKSSLWNDCYGPFSSQKTPKKGKIMFRPGSEKNYKKIWLFSMSSLINRSKCLNLDCQDFFRDLNKSSDVRNFNLRIRWYF